MTPGGIRNSSTKVRLGNEGHHAQFSRSCQNGSCGHKYTSPGLEDVMDVGLIGLGNMGTGIARSLLRAGHRVTVYNRTRERAEVLRKDGANVATSVAEACRSDAVLTMVADDVAVESVAFGDGGILRSLPRG